MPTIRKRGDANAIIVGSNGSTTAPSMFKFADGAHTTLIRNVECRVKHVVSLFTYTIYTIIVLNIST